MLQRPYIITSRLTGTHRKPMGLQLVKYIRETLSDDFYNDDVYIQSHTLLFISGMYYTLYRIYIYYTIQGNRVMNASPVF